LVSILLKHSTWRCAWDSPASQVEEGADPSQIKSAYRKLQKKVHPDIAGEQGHEMSMLLNKVRPSS